ncbi:MAG TPA: hypothetical protein VF615_01850 [Longimicrobiaceae bacterium]
MGEALERLAWSSETVPAALTRGVYLECRLSADTRVDLVLQVDERGRAVLAGTHPAVRLPRQLHAHPYWEEVRRLHTRWADTTSPIASYLKGVWLEFDVQEAGNETAVPLPGVFLKLAESALAGPAAPLEEVLASLPGLSPAPDPVGRIRRCIDELPPGAHVSYLGSFAPRGTDAVRVCMVGLPEDAISAYLARVEWPGDPHALGDLLATVGTADGRRLHQGPGMLHLDVGEDGVQPRVGLEYVLERGGQIRGRLHETEFLDHLVELGLCTAAKREGLLAWPGYSFEDFAHELWPSLVKRRVNHVKLVYEPRRPPEAKAYLCAFSEFYRGKTHPHEEEPHGRAAPAAV